MLMNVFFKKIKKNYLLIIKSSLIGCAFAYIYIHLQKTTASFGTELLHIFSVKTVIILFFFSGLNWFLEIKKWQIVVQTIQPISFLESLKQTLASLAISVITPNRIGEYGGKILFFKKNKMRKIIALNFIINSIQMLVTTIFGVLGCFFFKFSVKKEWYYGIGLLILVLFILFLVRKKTFLGISIEQIVTKMKEVPLRIYKKTLLLSVVRYLVFAHQFYYLLYYLQVPISYYLAITTIVAMYFLASILPSIALVDVAIKGSVALFLFEKINVDTIKIITATTTMWLFNLVFPVLIGCYFVWKFKPLNFLQND